MEAANWWSIIPSIAASVAALASVYVVLYVRAALGDFRDDMKTWAASRFPDRELCQRLHQEVDRRLGNLEE